VIVDPQYLKQSADQQFDHCKPQLYQAIQLTARYQSLWYTCHKFICWWLVSTRLGFEKHQWRAFQTFPNQMMRYPPSDNKTMLVKIKATERMSIQCLVHCGGQLTLNLSDGLSSRLE
jgi:hypothetical protein